MHHHSFHFSKTFSSRVIACIFFPFISLSLSPLLSQPAFTMNPDNNLVARTNTVLPPRRKPSSSTQRQSDIPNNNNNHHQRVVSMSSVSSRGSSTFASPRYPSGMTTLTSLSSDPPSTCISRSSSTSVNNNNAYQHHQQYDTNPISEDQFDIINNLDYDDVDDGLIGAYINILLLLLLSLN